MNGINIDNLNKAFRSGWKLKELVEISPYKSRKGLYKLLSRLGYTSVTQYVKKPSNDKNKIQWDDIFYVDI